MRNREPMINPLIKGALWSPNTGLIDPCVAALSIAFNSMLNGASIKLNTCFKNFIFADNRIIGITTNQEEFNTRWVINAAGVHADEIMHLTGDQLDFSIVPRRGEYILMNGHGFSINNLLSPVPNRITKGIAVKPTLDHRVLVGSNAQAISKKDDILNTRAGLMEVWEGARMLIPSLSKEHIIAVYSGLRASGNALCKNSKIDYHADFIIEKSMKVDGLINIAGIESPGLTAAPAIANRTIGILKEAGEYMRLRRSWSPNGKGIDESSILKRAIQIQESKYIRDWDRFFTE
jgi:glycerol-3-phosphate dehydrogenase